MTGKHTTLRRFFLCLLIAWMSAGVAAAQSDSTIYYSADTFTITEFDRAMYLRNAPPSADGSIGSRARNLQALSDLYAMQILAGDARHLDLITEEEQAWLAGFAVNVELVNRYLKQVVTDQMSATDWKGEAKEAYLASPQDYVVPEMVSVRTLLIRTENRTEAEALAIATALLGEATNAGADFAQLVIDNTEDENAVANAGLMPDVRRGVTVPEFEEAAFALTDPGELSEPVVSEFGVHLIELLEYKPAQQLSFEQVERQIIEQLKPIRRAQYFEALQNEARERKPDGFVEHTGALDNLISRTSDGSLGSSFLNVEGD